GTVTVQQQDGRQQGRLNVGQLQAYDLGRAIGTGRGARKGLQRQAVTRQWQAARERLRRLRVPEILRQGNETAQKAVIVHQVRGNRFIHKISSSPSMRSSALRRRRRALRRWLSFSSACGGRSVRLTTPLLTSTSIRSSRTRINSPSIRARSALEPCEAPWESDSSVMSWFRRYEHGRIQPLPIAH